MDFDILGEYKYWNWYDCVISTWSFIPLVLLTLPIGHNYSRILSTYNRDAILAI